MRADAAEHSVAQYFPTRNTETLQKPSNDGRFLHRSLRWTDTRLTTLLLWSAAARAPERHQPVRPGARTRGACARTQAPRHTPACRPRSTATGVPFQSRTSSPLLTILGVA